MCDDYTEKDSFDKVIDDAHEEALDYYKKRGASDYFLEEFDIDASQKIDLVKRTIVICYTLSQEELENEAENILGD